MTHIQLDGKLLRKLGYPHSRSCRLCLSTCRKADTTMGRTLLWPCAAKARPQEGVLKCHKLKPPQHCVLLSGPNNPLQRNLPIKVL